MKLLMTIIAIFVFSSSAYSSEVSDAAKGLKKGKEIYLNAIIENGTFDYLLYLMEYGNAEAIEFAPTLKKYTDAAVTEELMIAVARGLPKNPSAVLAIIGDDFPIDTVCTVPFIEAPKDIVEIHIEQSKVALKASSYTEQKLETVRIECLKIFNNLSK